MKGGRLQPELLKFYRMYAIVDIAGQQFKVEAGAEIFVNRLSAKNDETVEFDKVLLLDNEGEVKVGAPYVEGAVVKATVLNEEKESRAKHIKETYKSLMQEIKSYNEDYNEPAQIPFASTFSKLFDSLF